MPDNLTPSGTTKISESRSIAIFYAATFLGLLLVTAATSGLGELGDLIISWGALMIMPVTLAFILACISEIRFHRVAASPSGNRLRDVRYIIWPILAVMFGLLATLPLPNWYVPKSDLARFVFWFGWPSSLYAVWILVAGLVDILATWYRSSSSEHRCRMRLRGWVAIVFAQQLMLVFMEIVRGLADGFNPQVYWAYVGAIITLTTIVITIRFIVLLVSSPRTT